MSSLDCTNCGLPTQEDEHHVRIPRSDAFEPNACIRVRLELFRTSDGYMSRSRVLGTAPQCQAAKLAPDNTIKL